MQMLPEKKSCYVCATERGQALLFGRIEIEFVEDGGNFPWFWNYLENWTEMIKETFHMERAERKERMKGRDGKGKAVRRQIREIGNASIL